MKLWTLEQLSQLPEARAVQKHFDRLNYRVLRWAWRISVLVAFGFFIASSVDGDFLPFVQRMLRQPSKHSPVVACQSHRLSRNRPPRTGANRDVRWLAVELDA